MAGPVWLRPFNAAEKKAYIALCRQNQLSPLTQPAGGRLFAICLGQQTVGALALSLDKGDASRSVATLQIPLPAHRRQGIGTQALALAAVYSFAGCGLQNLYLPAPQNSPPLVRIAQKLGLVWAGPCPWADGQPCYTLASPDIDD